MRLIGGIAPSRREGMQIVKFLLLSAVAAVALTSTMVSAATLGSGIAKEEATGFEQKEYVAPVASDFTPGGAAATPLLAASIGVKRQSALFTPTAFVKRSFEGISQYDVASYARNFVPPDTMGAVGTTQYSEFVNGGFAVFDKSTTNVVKATSDVAFWAAAGQVGTNGDSRVMFDKASKRWVALAFGASVGDIQIAVSDTADAAGTWKSTKFTGYAGAAPGITGVADYPTLALDTNAVYIGTNNFGASTPGGPQNFRGTTMNIIPLSSIINGLAPTTTGLKQFNTPYTPGPGGGGYEGGYAIQGVNSSTPGTVGRLQAASLFYETEVRFDITNPGTAGATKVNGQYLNLKPYDEAGPGRQPNAVPDAFTTGQYPNNNRVIDTLDSRISSSVFEVNGLIYSVHTVKPLHSDYSEVRYTVVDAATNTVVNEGKIGDGAHDYFQGSLSVNSKGQVVIAYNRSGSGADGKISIFAREYSTSATGRLVQRGAEIFIKESVVDDYHNGSVDGFVAAGRQRWGDYSSVSLDPSNDSHFWLIGEFAREYNDGTDHPGGTGGSRWSTWIAEIDASAAGPVPEPASWAMMVAGFGLVGMLRRRSRATVAS